MDNKIYKILNTPMGMYFLVFVVEPSGECKLKYIHESNYLQN